MTRPLIGIFDVETQEQINREMNDEEYAQYLIDFARAEEELAAEATAKAEADAAAEAKAEAKRQALTALGLSQEIVNLLAE
jgi:hypothetical protein